MSQTTQENLLFRITVEQTGSSIGEIDQLTKSITGLNTAAKGTGGAGTGGLQKMLDGINMSAKELNTTLTSLNTSFNKLNSGTAAASMSKLSSSTEQASAALQAGTRAAEGFANSTIGAGKGVTTVSDQLGILKTSATTATTATNVLTAGFEKFATAGAMAEKNMFGVANTLSTFGRQADSAAASAQKLGQAENSATSATQRMTQASEASNVASQSGLGYDKERAQQWIQNIRHISGVGLSFMSLYQAMDSVQGIGQMVALQQEKVAEAHQRVVDALAKYGKNSKQYIQAVDAEQKATRGLTYEQREASFAMHNMLFMVGLIGIELTNSLLPILVKAGAALKGLNSSTTMAAAGVSNVAESVSNSVPGFDLYGKGAKKAEQSTISMAEKAVGAAPSIGYIGKGLEDVSRKASGAAPDIAHVGEKATEMGADVLMGAEATTKMSLGQKIMSAASKIGMVALGGLGVSAGTAAVAVIATTTAAAIAAAGLVLYGTNAFGARDAMNGMGVAIGKVNPVLKTVGDLAVIVAGSFGLTGENAAKAQGHIADLNKDFGVLSTTWNDVVANMQQSDNIIVKDFGNALSLIGSDLQTMAGHFTTQVGASISTWNKLTDALEKHDYKTAVNIIEQAFSAIPGVIQQIFVDVGKVFTDFERGQNAFWKNLWTTIGPTITAGLGTLGQMFQKGLEALVGIATEVLKRVATALGLDPVIANIQRGVQVIVSTFNGIVAGINDMGKAIMDKILGHEQFDKDAQAWMNTNIYTPLGKVVEGVVAQGKEIVTKLLSGDIAGAVTSWVGGLTKQLGNVGKTITDALGITKAAPPTGADQTKAGAPNPFDIFKPPQEQQDSSKNYQDQLARTLAEQNAAAKPIDKNAAATAGVEGIAYNPFGQQQAGYQFAGLNGTIAQGPLGTKPQGQASPTGSSEGDRASVGAAGTPSGVLGDAPQVQSSAPPAGAAAGKKPEVTLTPKMEESSGGIRDENKAYQELDDTVKKLQTSYKDYNEILTTNKGINELQSKGIVEQQTAYQGMQAQLVSSKAANQEYAQQVKDGGILTTSFNQGIEDEKKALLDEQTALKNSQGRHAELANQMSTTGVPQINAFNQGMDEQVGALQQQQLSTAKSAGTIKELSAEMGNNTAQTAAYGEGFVGATLAIDQQQVAVEKTHGTLDAFNHAMYTGQLQTIAYGEGVNQQSQALIDNYTAMNQAQGGLDQYNKQLVTGLPQAIAWKTAMLAQQMAAAKLKEEIAGLEGTVAGMINNLKNSQTVMDMQHKAYLEGAQAAAEWGAELVTADSKQQGMMDGLQHVADALGVSTEGFVGNADELKTWIGVMGGVTSVINEVSGKLYEQGTQMMSKFSDSLKEGATGIKEATKGIEDEVGYKLTGRMQDAMEQAGLRDVVSEQLGASLALGMKIFQTADTGAMSDWASQTYGRFNDTVSQMDPQMRAKVQGTIDAINDILTHPPTTGDAAGFTKYAAELSVQMASLQAQSNPTKAALQGVAGVNMTGDLKPKYDELLAAVKNNQPLTAAQQALLNASTAGTQFGQAIFDAQGHLTGFTGAAGGAGTAAGTAAGALTGAATATTGLGTATTGANTEMQTFTTTMGTMETVVQQVVTNIIQQFTTGFATMFSTVQAQETAFIATFQTTFAAGISELATPLAQMVQAFQITFSTILQNITTFMQQFLQKVQQGIQQITTAVNTLVGVFNNAFKRAVDDAEGYLKSLVQVNNQTFQQITSAVTKVVGAFNDSFKRATSDAGGYLKQLGTLAGQVMQQIAQKAATAAQGIAKIGQSAQQAASQVRSLANEINSLKDKTVYINIVRRYSGPAYAAGTPGAVFMGKGGQMTSVVYGDRAGTRNSRVIVGESGDETVMRTGLKSNRTRIDNVKHIKYITGLGANEPEMLTVVPQEGTNAQQFRNKYPEFYADGTPGIYNAGSYPNPFAAANNPPSAGRQMPSGFSQMLYGRITKDRHGNITIGGRVVFRAGGPLDIDAYEGRHISHGSHGDPDDKHHFQQFDGSNEDIKHNGIPFSFGSATGFQVQKGMETGIGGTRGQVVGGPMGTGVMTKAMMDEMNPADTVPAASMDRMVQSRRVYSDYISERVAAARDRPRAQQQDSVYGNVDNQGNPLSMEYNENAYPTGIEADTPLMHPHTRGATQIKPTRSYEEDYNVFIARLINEITKKVDGKIKINLHSQVDTRIWGKITNSQVLNDMVRS